MIKITIEGPGKTFDTIVDVVRRELYERGAKVTTFNKHPPEKPHYAQYQIFDQPIDIHVIHHPWGG